MQKSQKVACVLGAICPKISKISFLVSGGGGRFAKKRGRYFCPMPIIYDNYSQKCFDNKLTNKKMFVELLIFSS